ncbi:MAG: hypothetical protein F4236_04375 [Acidimicrobiia bacterium]|nr:hypothetical protein [bacterium]MXZ29485.1 hypothetical protein [Acidimicrobiia bacterium]MYE67409.1 hypothetical protein [Acidimicrobiia bacterium]
MIQLRGSASLRRALRGRLDLQAQDQSYFDEGRAVSIMPDLVFRSAGADRFVADIKYKLSDESVAGPNADLYQLLAYTTALDLPEGLLIYCLNADGSPDAVSGEHRPDDRSNGISRRRSLEQPDAAELFERASAVTRVEPIPLTPAAAVARANYSSVRVRHAGTVLHKHALDLSGTPDEIRNNINALADWIADRAPSRGRHRVA